MAEGCGTEVADVGCFKKKASWDWNVSFIYRFQSGFSIFVDKKHVLNGSLFPLTADLRPLSCLFLPLQRQVAGEVQTQPQDRAVNQIAMMLAIMGLSLSYYSAKQMTEKVQAQPAPWRDLTTRIVMKEEPIRSEKV